MPRGTQPEPGSGARALDEARAGEPIFTGHVPILLLDGASESYRARLDAAISAAWGDLKVSFEGAVNAGEIECYGWPDIAPHSGASACGRA